MSKKREVWIKPPSKEFVHQWKIFLLTGNWLKDKLDCIRLGRLDQEDLAEIMKSVAGEKLPSEDKELSKKEKKFINSSEEADFVGWNFDLTKRKKNEFFRSLIYKKGFFPFIDYEKTPISAIAILALLTSSFIENLAEGTFSEVYKLFKILRIPFEEYKSEGEKLVEYSKSSEYLGLKETKDSFPYNFFITKKGFKEILGIEIHKERSRDFSLENFNPFFGRMMSSKNKGDDFEQCVISSTVELKDVALDDETRIKIDFLIKSQQKLKAINFKVLFYGPPGTGKTHTAYAIAGELKRNLLIVDLSNVMDKFLGETEKILSKHFNYAEKNNCIILVDEADSLLNERKSYKKSWENNMVNHLLSLMEQKNVSVILCTNLYDVIDEALFRRLDEVIEYKMPSNVQRRKIWEIELSKISCEEVDLDKLSEVELSGGLIANVAKRVSRIKAVTSEKIDTALLMNLAISEQKKIKRRDLSKRISGFGG